MWMYLFFCCCVIYTKNNKVFCFAGEFLGCSHSFPYTLASTMGLPLSNPKPSEQLYHFLWKRKTRFDSRTSALLSQYVGDQLHNLPVSKNNFKLALWGSAGKVPYIPWSFKIHGYHVILNYLLWQLHLKQKKLEPPKATKSFHLIIFNTARKLSSHLLWWLYLFIVGVLRERQSKWHGSTSIYLDNWIEIKYVKF